MGKTKCKKKGFTLIELIVVIAVLAILALLAVPGYFGLKEKSKQSVCETNRRQIERQFIYALSVGMHIDGDNYDQKLEDFLNDIMKETPVKYKGFDVEGDKLCPSGGTFSAVSGQIYCSVHGEMGESLSLEQLAGSNIPLYSLYGNNNEYAMDWGGANSSNQKLYDRGLIKSVSNPLLDKLGYSEDALFTNPQTGEKYSIKDADWSWYIETGVSQRKAFYLATDTRTGNIGDTYAQTRLIFVPDNYVGYTSKTGTLLKVKEDSSGNVGTVNVGGYWSSSRTSADLVNKLKANGYEVVASGIEIDE